MHGFGGKGLSLSQTIPETMCLTAVSGCSEIAAASPAFTRDHLDLDVIEVNLRLALGNISKRDDADFIFIRRMYN